MERSPFGLWYNGQTQNISNFQSKLFQAFIAADYDNRVRMANGLQMYFNHDDVGFNY